MKPEERLEQLQADHEMFLQAFEKPTQIYRYLRTRNLISPIFLHRSLTFMRSRLSRNNSVRRSFKVDSLLDKKLKDGLQHGLLEPQALKGFMTLTFLGYYDKRRERPLERVRVDLLLVKMAHKKRKESTSPLVQVSLGASEVPVNPSEEHPPSKAPALSIPSSNFSLGDGHETKSYTLVLRVHQSPATQSNGTVNGEENLEPAAKRRKLLRGSMDDGKILSSELVVYDKHSRCLLTEGEYELVLCEVGGNNGVGNSNGDKISPKKNNSSWETISIDKCDKSIADQFDVFGCCPTLKFRLSWSGDSAGDLVDRPRPLMPRDNTQDLAALRCKERSKARSVKQAQRKQQQQLLPVERPPLIVYQFLYNNNSRQQTEAREDLHCPWCSLNCLELYALLKHLKLSHPRFLFTYVPIEEGARIDVSVSEWYDSTYVGNPHDLISQPPGFAFSRSGPVQRTSITNILVCKPKRTARSLSEFLEVEGDNDLNGPYDGQRPFVTGHNRLYHYSTTCLPMPPHAIIQPSTEDQVDPPWLMTKTCRMIDEFSDVNEGEKDFMKMWNLHVQHHVFVGDCQMKYALKSFIEEKGRELMEKNLYRNFILHCCNLFEFGVIGPALILTAVSRVQLLLKESGLGRVGEDWLLQRSQWMQQHDLKPVCPVGGGEKLRKDFSGLFKSETVTAKTEEKPVNNVAGSSSVMAAIIEGVNGTVPPCSPKLAAAPGNPSLATTNGSPSLTLTASSSLTAAAASASSPAAVAGTPKASIATASASPATPKASIATASASPATPKASIATASASPATPNASIATASASSATPKANIATACASPATPKANNLAASTQKANNLAASAATPNASLAAATQKASIPAVAAAAQSPSLPV